MSLYSNSSNGQMVHSIKKSKVQKNKLAPFPFSYIEKQLRKKSFGIITTSTPQGITHSVGVVYGVAPPNLPFTLYLLSSPTSKKARNIQNNPNISFVVPYPHYLFRMIPPSCIQFQGKAEPIPADDPIATKVFQNSFVLHRSLTHSIEMSELVFFRIVPDKKIFCWGIGAKLWQFIIPSQSKKLENLYVIIPENRQATQN